MQDPGNVGQGIVVRIFTSAQNAGLLTTGDSVTITMSSNTAALCYSFYQVSRGSNAAVYVTGGTTSGAGTSGTITTGTITNGDVVIGVTGIEQDDTVTADSDTSNGSWANTQTSVNSDWGANTLSIRISTQTKIVTATATQTYNTSWATSTDYALAWIELG